MPRGMLACGAGICAWLTSSGESTVDSPSTPFSLPGAGSGAFKQAWGGLVSAPVRIVEDRESILELGSCLRP